MTKSFDQCSENRSIYCVYWVLFLLFQQEYNLTSGQYSQGCQASVISYQHCLECWYEITDAWPPNTWNRVLVKQKDMGLKCSSSDIYMSTCRHFAPVISNLTPFYYAETKSKRKRYPLIIPGPCSLWTLPEITIGNWQYFLVSLV